MPHYVSSNSFCIIDNFALTDFRLVTFEKYIVSLARLPIAESSLPKLSIPDIKTKNLSRILEFRLGRHLAQIILSSKFNCSESVGRDDSGAPVFPFGFNGSISHTQTDSHIYAAACISPANIRCGVDIEHRSRTLTPKIVARLANQELEVNCLKDETERMRWFQRKEATYKALYPMFPVLSSFTCVVSEDFTKVVYSLDSAFKEIVLASCSLDFHDARIEIVSSEVPTS